MDYWSTSVKATKYAATNTRSTTTQTCILARVAIVRVQLGHYLYTEQSEMAKPSS